MNAWQKIICVAIAGGLGTLARYGLTGLVQRIAGSAFPWGTLVANTAGCFLFGFIWVLAAERMVINSDARLLILTGFMGAFTTFSTFTAETGNMFAGAQWMGGALNIICGIAAGLFFFFLGQALGRWI